MVTSNGNKGTLGSRRFLLDTLRYLPATVLPAVFSIVGASIFTRLFPPAEYGLYSLIIAISGPVTQILTEWAAQPIGRFYAEYERRGRTREVNQLIVTFSYAISLIVIALSALLVGAFIVARGSAPSPVLISGAVFAVLAQCLNSVALPVLNARMQVGSYRTILVLGAGLAVAISLGLIYLLGRDVAWLLWGQGAAAVLLLPWIYNKARLRSFTPLWRFSPRTFHTLRRMWRFGAPMMLWFLAAGIITAQDRFFIQAFRGTAEVGIYSVNYALVAGLGGLMNTAVMVAAGPILYRLWAHRRINQAATLIKQMTEIYAVLALALLGCIVVAGHPIANILLGQEFRDGAVIMVPILLGRLLWGASIIGHKGLELQEKTTRVFWSGISTAAFCVLLNLVLVPRFGYVGAAYTALAGYIFYACAIWRQSRSAIPWHLDARVLFSYAGIMLTASAIALSSVAALSISGDLPTIIVGTGVFLATYFALLFGIFGGRVLSLTGHGAKV